MRVCQMKCLTWMKHSSISCGRIVTSLQMFEKTYPPMFAFVWRKCSRHTSCLPKSQSQAYREKERERLGSTFGSTFCTVEIKGVSLLKHSTTVNMAIHVVELIMSGVNFWFITPCIGLKFIQRCRICSYLEMRNPKQSGS